MAESSSLAGSRVALKKRVALDEKAYVISPVVVARRHACLERWRGHKSADHEWLWEEELVLCRDKVYNGVQLRALRFPFGSQRPSLTFRRRATAARRRFTAACRSAALPQPSTTASSLHTAALQPHLRRLPPLRRRPPLLCRQADRGVVLYGSRSALGSAMLALLVRLPTTAAGFDIIQNHVDLLSGKVHAVPTPTATAADAAAIIRDMCLWSGDGFPDLLVMDHDSRFTSQVSRAFVKGWGSCLTVGSAYHKNTNAKVERLRATGTVTCRSPCLL